MKRARLFSLLAVVILVSAFAPAALAQGTLLIESEPDAAALYLGDLAYLHDQFTLPAGLAAQVVLPGSTIIDSLVITEGGARVPGYRVQTVEGRPAVQWEPVAAKASGPGAGLSGDRSGLESSLRYDDPFAGAGSDGLRGARLLDRPVAGRGRPAPGGGHARWSSYTPI
jgi:hypothetical protein